MPGKVLKFLANDNNEWEIVPTVEGVAEYLDIDTDTIVEWCKDEIKQDFSVAIKKVKAKQARLLQHKGLTKEFNPIMSIFLLKVNHGKTEKSAIDVTSGGKPIPAPMLGGKSVLPDNSNNQNNQPDKED